MEFASDRLKDDDMVVRRAILNYNTTALQFASERLKNNFDIVKTAVQMNPEVLQFASKELRNNEDIVKEAVAYDTQYFKFAGDKLKNNFLLLKLFLILIKKLLKTINGAKEMKIKQILGMIVCNSNKTSDLER